MHSSCQYVTQESSVLRQVSTRPCAEKQGGARKCASGEAGAAWLPGLLPPKIRCEKRGENARKSAICGYRGSTCMDNRAIYQRFSIFTGRFRRKTGACEPETAAAHARRAKQHVFDLCSSIGLHYRVRGFVRSRLADRTVRATTARLSRALRFGGPPEAMQGALVHHPSGPLLLGTQSAGAARAVTVRACPPGRVWKLRGLLDTCGVFTVPVCGSEQRSCHPVLPLASTGHAVTCTLAAGNRTRRDRDL